MHHESIPEKFKLGIHCLQKQSLHGLTPNNDPFSLVSILGCLEGDDDDYNVTVQKEIPRGHAVKALH